MGADKATLIMDGEPLWRRQVGLLWELKPEAVWVSVAAAWRWRPLDVEQVEDAPPSRGPLSGIAVGLRRLQTSHLMVLAVDLPQMTAGHLKKLWSLARPGVGVIPTRGGYFEPLCAIYPAEALAAAEESLSGRDSSLQNFCRLIMRKSQARVYEVTPEEKPFYLNLNSPGDLRRLAARARRKVT
jgi:molybdopterin-guanine dinucleotide biosynthesis protein A